MKKKQGESTMQLKPIMLLMLPHWRMISSEMLDQISMWARKENPNYFVLVMTSTEIEETVVEVSAWKTLSYQNYATLVKMVDEGAWETLEDWRLEQLFGGTEHLYLDGP